VVSDPLTACGNTKILSGSVTMPPLLPARLTALFRAGVVTRGGALDLAGAVGVDGQGPAEFVQDDVVVPPAIIFEVGEAGAAALGAMGDVVGFAGRGGLVAAAGELARLVPERDEAAQVAVVGQFSH
jgi:hypothetical protein